MEQGLILLVASLMVCLAPGVHGTAHLMFAVNATANVTREGCGMTKLCVETPEDCDPAGSSNCLFVSLIASAPMAPNGADVMVQLRGDSAGYVALGLTASATEGVTKVFVCAQNAGTFFFRTLQRNNSMSNGTLTPVETLVKEIRGSVNGNVIQCEFTIRGANSTSTRTSHVTTFGVLLGTGTTEGTNVGDLSVSQNSGPLNLANPAANVATNATTVAPTIAPTTAAPTTATTIPPTTILPTTSNTTMMTTAGASGASQPHAVLVLLSALIGSALLRT